MRFFGIIAFIFSGWMGLAAQPRIQSSLSRDSIQIGEQFSLDIQLLSAGSVKSAVPDPGKSLPAGVEILAESTDSSSIENGIHFSYILTSFDTGRYEISPVEVLVNDGNRLDTLFTGNLVFAVYSPEVDTTAEIRDIKDPFKTPFILKELLPYTPWTGSALVLAALLVLVIWYLRRRKKSAEKAEEILPPHIRALARLGKIREEKLWQSGRVKEYYVELSETVRQYIEERFGIPAMESVTAEILHDFKKFSYEDEYLLEILENLLNLSDLVKFAKEDPSPAENETNLNQAFILVEKTKPVEKMQEETDL